MKKKMDNYGWELILDMHECNVNTFNRENIDSFFQQVCDKTKMQKCELFWWDDYEVPKEEKQVNPKTKGTTFAGFALPKGVWKEIMKGKRIAVQFILTSNITIHTLDELGNVYINFFSCKDFKSDTVRALALNYFGGNVVNCLLIKRK